MNFKTYEEAVEWITGLTRFGIRPGLHRMELLMEKLNHPHRRLKFIHVAGTNGKGSTCAYLTQVLIESGYRVGSFNSPYITRYTDRIRFNGHDIADNIVIQIANQLKPIADEIALSEWGSPTGFEISTALAICYFAQHVFPDYVVWETGLGGRLDSTNIVHPILSVITNIGHDHMEILGNTLELVALEKCGIIRSGVPVISAVEQPAIIEVIKQYAADKKTTLYLMNRDFQVELISTELDKQVFDFQGPFRGISGIEITLNGIHQPKNAAVAMMVLEVLRQYQALLFDEEALYTGFRQTNWAGRLEMISQHPRLLIDGAHNPEGAEVLSASLREVYSYKKIHFMIGMLSMKNHSGYLRHILPIVDSLIITEPNFRNKMDAEQLAEQAVKLVKEIDRTIEIVVEPDWKKALELLRLMTETEDLGVVSGTLYLISDVRSWVIDGSDSEKGW